MKFGYGPLSSSNHIPVDFRSPSHLSSTVGHDTITFDISSPNLARILGEMESITEIETQLYCHWKVKLSVEGSARLNGRQNGRSTRLWFLNVIILGPESLGEKVGEYLSKYKMYLQDPLRCERHVPYRNPHIVTSDSDEIVMSDAFDLALENLEIESITSGPDLLAQLMEDDFPLAETEAPDIVTTALFP